MSAEEAKAPPVEGEEVPGEEGVEAEKVEAPPEEEVIVAMGLDEFYPEGFVDKVIPDSALSKRTMNFYECLG
jgi:hypothetical protein